MVQYCKPNDRLDDRIMNQIIIIRSHLWIVFIWIIIMSYIWITTLWIELFSHLCIDHHPCQNRWQNILDPICQHLLNIDSKISIKLKAQFAPNNIQTFVWEDQESIILLLFGCQTLHTMWCVIMPIYSIVENHNMFKCFFSYWIINSKEHRLPNNRSTQKRKIK